MRRVVVTYSGSGRDRRELPRKAAIEWQFRRFRSSGRQIGYKSSRGVAAFGATHRRARSPLTREPLAKRRLEGSVIEYVRDATHPTKASDEIQNFAPERSRRSARFRVSPLRHSDPIRGAARGELNVLRWATRYRVVHVGRETIGPDDLELELHAAREESSGEERSLIRVRIHLRYGSRRSPRRDSRVRTCGWSPSLWGKRWTRFDRCMSDN
jgi:hypothetical protein